MQHTDTLHTCDVCGMGMHGYFPVSLHNINMKVCNTCHTKLLAMRDGLPKRKFMFEVWITVEDRTALAAEAVLTRKLDRSGLDANITAYTEVTDASAGHRDTEPSPGSEEAGSSVDSGESRASTGTTHSTPDDIVTTGRYG